ncbi:hypothetical protein ACFL6T_02930 [Candidatus Zixiibacteriota bacterium]
MTDNSAHQDQNKEFPFIPRIVNPIKIGQVVVFAGETLVREAAGLLVEDMPWLESVVLSDPVSATNFQAEDAVVFIFDDTALPIVDTDTIRVNNPQAVIVLLSANPFIQCSPPGPARERYPWTAGADLVFAYDPTECLPRIIITPAVRAAEDLINIRASSDVRRFIFLVVDDEPRWLSQFLPVLYSIIAQRACVMVTRTFEEALQFLLAAEREEDLEPRTIRSQGLAKDVVFLITDIFFPREEEPESDAGRDLIRLVNRYYPRIPIVIASKAEEAESFRDQAFVLPKGDPGSLEELNAYIRDFSGMGSFLIRDENGQELYRLKNIRELYEVILSADAEDEDGLALRAIIETYAQNDRFSTWLYMHSYRELADILRPRHTQGKELTSFLKESLRVQIEQLERTSLVINGTRITSLSELLEFLHTTTQEEIQPLSNNDVFSSWLDRKGFPELAEELRPIHGSGEELRTILIDVIGKWRAYYESQDG